jgi:metal-responsive CopG/Arc/MetJ family transcriptional regulator
MSAKKISISVESKLLATIDKVRRESGESRSGLIARLLRAWMESQTCRESGCVKKKNSD